MDLDEDLNRARHIALNVWSEIFNNKDLNMYSQSEKELCTRSSGDLTSTVNTFRNKPRESSFNIMFVCLGNICRSPAAECIFRHLVEQQSSSFNVQSCGLGGGVDDWYVSGFNYHAFDKADHRMIRTVKEKFNIDLTSKSTVFTRNDLFRSDLIVALDMSLKKSIIHAAERWDTMTSSNDKEPNPNVFTYRELARNKVVLLRAFDLTRFGKKQVIKGKRSESSETLVSKLPNAKAQKNDASGFVDTIYCGIMNRAYSASTHDVPDPYCKSLETFSFVVDMIMSSCKVLYKVCVSPGLSYKQYEMLLNEAGELP